MPDDLDRINLRTMRSAGVVAKYAGLGALAPHERAALDRVAAECARAPILDLGVGGGRTVPALLEVSEDYLGIDYSPEMIAACRARFPVSRFPTARFEVGDARRLEPIATATIGLVMFACNGISMVGHDDRLAILREAWRVLRPGGVLLFTTYNRNSPEATARFRWPEFRPSPNPARFAVRGLRFARDAVVSIVNRRRHVRFERHSERYAVINDYCHNYGVMLYYITPADQRRQLEEVGFAPAAEAFDGDGRPMTPAARSNSMAFIARKAGAQTAGCPPDRSRRGAYEGEGRQGAAQTSRETVATSA